MSVLRVRRGVYQVRWREAGRGSPAHSVMVYGATDGEAQAQGGTVDAEIRNRKAVGERVISLRRSADPLTLAEFLPVWHEAYGKSWRGSTQAELRGGVGQVDRRRGSAGGCCRTSRRASSSRFRVEIERDGRGRADGAARCSRCSVRCSRRRCVRDTSDESDAGDQPAEAASPTRGAAADARASGDHPRRPGLGRRPQRW